MNRSENIFMTSQARCEFQHFLKTQAHRLRKCQWWGYSF